MDSIIPPNTPQNIPKAPATKTIVIGIGNTARGDDGLGWQFIDQVSQRPEYPFCAEQVYHLQVEDAELISHYQCVFFVDAFQSGLQKGFQIEPVIPNRDISYTTHALSPETLLGLCSTLYDAYPVAWIIKIEGVQWDLGLGLSDVGRKNLSAAVDRFYQFIRS